MYYYYHYWYSSNALKNFTNQTILQLPYHSFAYTKKAQQCSIPNGILNSNRLPKFLCSGASAFPFHVDPFGCDKLQQDLATSSGRTTSSFFCEHYWLVCFVQERMNRRSSQKTNSFDNDGKLLYRPTRLVRRDLPFFQSRNELNVYLHGLKKHAGKLRQYDWFHVWLRQPTVKSCVLMLACWTVAILVFAGLYMAVDHAYSGTKCSMLSPTDTRTVMNYGGYFAFSLETTTTVGYGLPNGSNAFFEPCPALQTVMYLQMVWSMMFNAFLFAFFFSRLAKSENRAAQVIFSKSALT